MKHLKSLIILMCLSTVCQGEDLLKDLSLEDPSREDIEAAEALVASAKTKVDLGDLEAFINAFPKTPSNKVMKEVQAFIDTGPGCKTCTSNVDLSSSLEIELNPGQSLDVFVSLSLGSEILKQLSQETSKVGGRLILQGLLNDSFPETQKAIKDLGITIDIDPPAFEESGVIQVPTFVLKEGKIEDRISGIRSLDSVLELFADQGETTTAPNLLKLLRKGAFR